jgi:hypothetical protein
MTSLRAETELGSKQGPSDGRGLDGFNRALAIVVAGTLAAGGTIAGMVAAGVLGPSISPGAWLRDQLQELAWLNGTSEIAAVALSGVAAICGLILLAAELGPIVRRPYLKAGNGTDREFAVQERAVEQMVRFAGEQLDEVLAVQNPRIGRDDYGLEVACEVILYADALAGPVAPLLEARIRNAVYTMTGLSVGRVKLRLRHAEPEQLAVR